MPNIEIHGVTFREGMEIADNIFGLFQDQPFYEEMVVEIYKTEVLDHRKTRQPFLRLSNSEPELNPKIVEKLKTLNMDIEVAAPLKEFIPKQDD